VSVVKRLNCSSEMHQDKMLISIADRTHCDASRQVVEIAAWRGAIGFARAAGAAAVARIVTKKAIGCMMMTGKSGSRKLCVRERRRRSQV